MRYISNTDGIFVARPGSAEFTLLCRIEELGIDQPNRVHRLDHDPLGAVYFSIRGGDRLYRMPPEQNRFHVVCEDLKGMVRGFDHHPSTGLLLAGRYALNGPARLLSSPDGENWSTHYEWNARHIHDVRVNPATGWIYVLVGEGDPRVTPDSHALYRSKDGSKFVKLFKHQRPFFLSVNFYRQLVILGTDHPEGGNGIYAFEDDGGDGPVSPEPVYCFPESHHGISHGPPFVQFLEWFHGSLFAGLRGTRLAYLLRSNNLVDWEILHMSRFPEMLMPYLSCSRGASGMFFVSGQPGHLIYTKEGAELYGVPLHGRPLPKTA